MDKLLRSSEVKKVLEVAAESHEKEQLRVVTAKSCVTLRNALITSLLVRSVRRAQEFTELTVGEWKARTLHSAETSVIKVKKHKTMSFGSADLILSKLEELALKAYMMYGRQFFTSCQLDGCPVFLSSTPSKGSGECCGKLHISNITAIIRKTAIRAGVTTRAVNTRMLRRSTISSAWSWNTDPSFRQELSQLAGHSYETARRYYAVYDTSKQSRKVVTTLEEYRE